MRVALYIGDHAQDAWSVRVGAALTRLVQKGEFGRVTHVEAILAEHGDGTVDIASSSLRDGGVRIKPRVALTAGHWLVVDVPQWNVERARGWFQAHDGEPYDSRGALATVLPGHHRGGAWFCNEAVGASAGLREPATFTPAQFAAICTSFGDDVTEAFFCTRAVHPSWVIA